MKRKKLLTLLLSTSLIFSSVGCTSTQAKTSSSTSNKTTQGIAKQNNNLTEKQVLEKFKKSVENLKSVTANYKITVNEVDKNNKVKQNGTKIQYDILSKVIYSGKDKDNYPIIEQIYDKSTQVVDGKKTQTSSYVNQKTKKAYYDADGKGLKEYKGKELKTETESNYATVAKMFLFTKTSADFVKYPKAQLQMSETATTYDFKFKGKNAPLLYAIDGLFGLAIDIQALEKIDIDVTYKISKKDFSIVEVTHSLLQTSKDKKYQSTGKYTVTSVNNIKVIDEAKNLK